MPVQETTVSGFVDAMARMRLPDVFNPYSDQCSVHDDECSAVIRRLNLTAAVNAALSTGVRSLWVGRDLGYFGGRRTGLAFTDEAHLKDYERILGISGLRKATSGLLSRERSATIVWESIRAMGEPVFLWNVFPFHPHFPDNQLSNRPHTTEEAQLCRPFLTWLIERLRPREILAIGQHAHRALAQVGVEVVHVRHPSYGGQREFRESVAEHYSCRR
jgi:uracil-DNA glycosylase